MTGWILFGVLVLLMCMAAFLLSRRAASRRERAGYAHSEPGGPGTPPLDEASRVIAARGLARDTGAWPGGF